MRYDDIFTFTDIGSREHNEDAEKYWVGNDEAIFVVADGLGGLSYGELASGSVTSTFTEDFKEDHPEIGKSWLEEEFIKVNEVILSQQREKGRIMKSTAAVLEIIGDQAFWGHAGDSRIYYIHDGAVLPVTADHSVAYMKYRAGEISKLDIPTDPDQSSLLRSVGNKQGVRPEFCKEPVSLSREDGFLLCTDGIWEYLIEEEVLIDYLKADSARDWGELLLVRVLSRINPEKNDNLTLMTVIVH